MRMKQIVPVIINANLIIRSVFSDMRSPCVRWSSSRRNAVPFVTKRIADCPGLVALGPSEAAL